MTIHSEGIGPTSNEKLREIQDAQKAVWAEIHGQDPRRSYSVAEVKRLIYSLDNAIATAVDCEKSHTSTEDEREAGDDYARRWCAQGASRAAGPNMKDSISDAFMAGTRFRRSEVPEPSAEVEDLKRQIAKVDADLTREVVRVEQLHDIADRLSWAIAPISEIGEHSSANDPWENAIEYAEAHVWAEPQGEPSDAQVLADEIEDRMRRQEWLPAGLAIRAVAALRAAGGVR